MSVLDFKLMGVNFRPKDGAARKIVASLEIGDELELRLEPEPDNQYDENAIKVIEVTSGEFLGYVEKEIAKVLAPLLSAGSTCVGFEVIDFHEGKGHVPVIRTELIARALADAPNVDETNYGDD